MLTTKTIVIYSVPDRAIYTGWETNGIAHARRCIGNDLSLTQAVMAVGPVVWSTRSFRDRLES